MSVFTTVLGYLKNILKAFSGKAKADAIAFFKSFSAEELGQLAVQAVIFAEANFTGSDAKRDAAVEKLLALAADHGLDLGNFAKSTLNFIIETTLQAIATGIANGPSAQ